MSKVILVNPANASVGYSVITPRWLYVIAGATPTEFAGDPVIIDEPIKAFDAKQSGPGRHRRRRHTHRKLPAWLSRREGRERAGRDGYRRRRSRHHLSGRAFGDGCRRGR